MTLFLVLLTRAQSAVHECSCGAVRWPEDSRSNFYMLVNSGVVKSQKEVLKQSEPKAATRYREHTRQKLCFRSPQCLIPCTDHAIRHWPLGEQSAQEKGVFAWQPGMNRSKRERLLDSCKLLTLQAYVLQAKMWSASGRLETVCIRGTAEGYCSRDAAVQARTDEHMLTVICLVALNIAVVVARPRAGVACLAVGQQGTTRACIQDSRSQ